MILLAMLLLPPLPEELTLPAKGQRGVTASLTVRVAAQTPQPGTARVRVRLVAEGPADMSVEGPVLEDALAGWKVPLRTSSYRVDGGCRWECDLELVQVKPGVVPLPGVRIRVLSGGSSENIHWPDLLHEAANVRSVVEVDELPPSPWPDRLRWAGLVAMGLVGVGGLVLGVRRWAARPLPAFPPLATALAAIDRLRDSTNDPTRLIAELDGVLRTYLESLGVPATRMSGAELRATPRADGLAAVLARGEELKFAGVAVTNAQVRDLAARARDVLLVAGGVSMSGAPRPGSP